MKIVWILNGCGLESGSITGSPLRFQAVSSRWQALAAEPEQHLVTTSGGEAMLRRMGCTLPATRLPAAQRELSPCATDSRCIVSTQCGRRNRFRSSISGNRPGRVAKNSHSQN
jgi:hypothetical protein